jgi:hypothetical protein
MFDEDDIQRLEYEVERELFEIEHKDCALLISNAPIFLPIDKSNHNMEVIDD